MDLKISAQSGRYDPDDDSWIAQATDLYQTLREDVPGYRSESVPRQGTKGTIDAVILSLGSAGAFSAAVECWRLWLSRDTSRKITINWTRAGHNEQIVLEGEGVNNDTFARLTETVRQRIATPDD
jgi:hypothetical protein